MKNKTVQVKKSMEEADKRMRKIKLGWIGKMEDRYDRKWWKICNMILTLRFEERQINMS